MKWKDEWGIPKDVIPQQVHAVKSMRTGHSPRTPNGVVIDNPRAFADLSPDTDDKVTESTRLMRENIRKARRAKRKQLRDENRIIKTNLVKCIL